MGLVVLLAGTVAGARGTVVAVRPQVPSGNWFALSPHLIVVLVGTTVVGTVVPEGTVVLVGTVVAVGTVVPEGTVVVGVVTGGGTSSPGTFGNGL